MSPEREMHEAGTCSSVHCLYCEAEEEAYMQAAELEGPNSYEFEETVERLIEEAFERLDGAA